MVEEVERKSEVEEEAIAAAAAAAEEEEEVEVVRLLLAGAAAAADDAACCSDEEEECCSMMMTTMMLFSMNEGEQRKVVAVGMGSLGDCDCARSKKLAPSPKERVMEGINNRDSSRIGTQGRKSPRTTSLKPMSMVRMSIFRAISLQSQSSHAAQTTAR